MWTTPQFDRNVAQQEIAMHRHIIQLRQITQVWGEFLSDIRNEQPQLLQFGKMSDFSGNGVGDFVVGKFQRGKTRQKSHIGGQGKVEPIPHKHKFHKVR